MKTIRSIRYKTEGGITVFRASVSAVYDKANVEIKAALDDRQGALFSSTFEFPGRYTRWDIGFINPPIKISATGRSLTIEALNERGKKLLKMMAGVIAACKAIAHIEKQDEKIDVILKAPQEVIFEEERSKQYTVFTVLRELTGFFGSDQDPYLGFYGAFGYELAFQFEDVKRQQERQDDGQNAARDMVLYLPDEIVVVDHQKQDARRHTYDFQCEEYSTRHLQRTGEVQEFTMPDATLHIDSCDHASGEYAETVKKALGYFARGDLFEAVPGQMFREKCIDTPSAIFSRLQERNPSPYGAFLNLGEEEYLVAASPEMFVRVENTAKGQRVETCPISGTIARGNNAIEDADQVRKLLNSAKDEAELSMCTDVDRNDKSRICVPGSVQVIGRRQIEMYSRLIHTVDHVEGLLRPEFDALDAFLSHAWAVTVTGAPKHAAIQFIEDHEKSPRRWYGGAMGFLKFNGEINTGLTLRTIRIDHGVAEVRAGATLLFDSDPQEEEAETRLKASALLSAIRNDDALNNAVHHTEALQKTMPEFNVLMVDHEDSFVHTLSAYFQKAGARVKTVRPHNIAQALKNHRIDLVVLSPGPGKPADFQLDKTIGLCLAKQIPLFGVCLGLQGLVEYFGGTLATLDYPMHGKSSSVEIANGALFANIPLPIKVGRYHSLVAQQVPDCLRVTAFAPDKSVMAVEHETLPISAVQFHPESILSLEQEVGIKIIGNVLKQVTMRAQV